MVASRPTNAATAIITKKLTGLNSLAILGAKQSYAILAGNILCQRIVGGSLFAKQLSVEATTCGFLGNFAEIVGFNRPNNRRDYLWERNLL